MLRTGARSGLGGVKAPGPLVVALIPSVIVQVRVFASVPKCVLESTHCVSETPCASGRPCVIGTTCARDMACVSERPCVRETACVRSLYVREMTAGMR